MRLRAMAFVCLALLLGLSLAGPLHHDSSPQAAASCLICHVTSRASVTPIAVDAGKPQPTRTIEILCAFNASMQTDAPDTIRPARAPPLSFLSL